MIITVRSRADIKEDNTLLKAVTNRDIISKATISKAVAISRADTRPADISSRADFHKTADISAIAISRTTTISRAHIRRALAISKATISRADFKPVRSARNRRGLMLTNAFAHAIRKAILIKITAPATPPFQRFCKPATAGMPRAFWKFCRMAMAF